MAKKKGSHFSRQFKLQAGGMAVEQGFSYSEVAKKLGISSRSVCNWVKSFRAEGVFPPADQPVPQAEEMKAIRKENARLKMENQILKKAAAYFARESL